MATISDVLIELLSFSKPELYELAALLRKDVPRGEKLDVALALSQQVTLADIREVAGQHLGAGRTSLSWVVLSSEYDVDEEIEVDQDCALSGEALTLQEVTKALRRMTRASNPYEFLPRPREVTTDPVLVNAQHDGDDLVLLTFAYQRSQRMIVRNFRFDHRPEDDFFHVVLRLSRAALEIRAEARVSGKLTRGWIHSFAEELDRVPLRIFLTQQDVDELRIALEARMDRHDARHEDEEVGYGRQLVTAGNLVRDLAELERFKEDFDGSDPIASDLLFGYTNGDGEEHEVRIRVSPRSGTVRCVNHVSNDVMEHVYDTLRKVRRQRA
jgi:hypothetical protein